jgi:thiamine-monophosphate kinase
MKEKKKKASGLARLGESGIIDQVRKLFQDAPPEILKGIGEDCAVLRSPSELILLSTDLLTEGVHFERSWAQAREIGRKALAINLSDIAAMGGTPNFALLSLGLPEDLEEAYLLDLLKGIRELAKQHGISIIGGNTSRSPQGIWISLTVLGKIAPQEVLYRSGARAGDHLLVSGFLGEARGGLEILKKGMAKPKYPKLVKAFLDPKPQMALSRLLARSGSVHAMIDLSDGLASDLDHLCQESGVGAEIYPSQIPISRSLRDLADKLGGNPLDWALRGGEDYALLFAVPPEGMERVVEGARDNLARKLWPIGRVIQEKGLWLVEEGRKRPLAQRGFDHFQSAV